jgi:hypothetical protein
VNSITETSTFKNVDKIKRVSLKQMLAASSSEFQVPLMTMGASGKPLVCVALQQLITI